MMWSKIKPTLFLVGTPILFIIYSWGPILNLFQYKKNYDKTDVIIYVLSILLFMLILFFIQKKFFDHFRENGLIVGLSIVSYIAGIVSIIIYIIAILVSMAFEGIGS